MSNFIYYEKLQDYEEQVRKAKEYDKLQQELQRKDNIINGIKELLKNPYNQDCINQNNDFLDKIKELEEK